MRRKDCTNQRQYVETDRRLDQYYTREDVAKHLYKIFLQYYDPAGFHLVEPSAGTGSFLKIMPAGSIGYDVDPKHPNIQRRDFLTVEFNGARRVAYVGNPPFGRNASMAVRFFNHAARDARVIAFILPRTFRKAAIVNRLNGNFHLVREEPVPKDAFLFRSKPYSVPAVFQIWEWREEMRTPLPTQTQHPDFDFVTPDRADFAIQRVGARAGQVHRNFAASPSAHYFIRGDVEHIMKQLDFRSVVGDVAGNPSLAKSEVVTLYRNWLGARRRPIRRGLARRKRPNR